MQHSIKEREYIKKIFLVGKRLEEVVQTEKDTPFNSTELRLLKELVLVKLENERIISTNLAKRLGVTRSSVSQMVNKLEKEGVVYRQPDEVDRKIAYIQMTESAEQLCMAELKKWTGALTEVVETFGEEKMQALLSLAEEFAQTAQTVKEKKQAK